MADIQEQNFIARMPLWAFILVSLVSLPVGLFVSTVLAVVIEYMRTGPDAPMPGYSYLICQRRRDHVSGRRREDASMMTARRLPNWGPFRQASGLGGIIRRRSAALVQSVDSGLILRGVKAGTVILYARIIVAVIVLGKARRIITDKMITAFMVAHDYGLADGIAGILPAVDPSWLGMRGNRDRRYAQHDTAESENSMFEFGHSSPTFLL